MTAPDNDPLRTSDRWLDHPGPEEHVVVSSRARYARNLPGIPFPMRAKAEELSSIVERVSDVLHRSPGFKDGASFDLAGIKSLERSFLRENLLISTEMEKGNHHRHVFLSSDIRLAVMLNEEDHLRMYALAVGFQPYDVLNRVIALESDLGRELGFAFSPKYGYLTACPTNTGTGLRASVMLHLPALTLANKMPEVIKTMPQFGLTVRGFYGEHSEHMGDFYQVSNEVTLGITEEDIVQKLVKVVEQVIQREEQARRALFDQNRAELEDSIWRSYGILTNARVMTSAEAVQLLSRLRFGIDRGYFASLTHAGLNKLIVDIQPGHLQLMSGSTAKGEARDALRADLLRKRLAANAANN